MTTRIKNIKGLWEVVTNASEMGGYYTHVIDSETGEVIVELHFNNWSQAQNEHSFITVRMTAGLDPVEDMITTHYMH